MELIIIFAFLILVLFVFKRFDSLVYFISILDIFLRIINFLKNNITSPEIQKFIGVYMPTSLPDVINKYTTGVFNEILIWAFVINFIVFEIYVIRTLLNKR